MGITQIKRSKDAPIFSDEQAHEIATMRRN
jgi:hypothetical protein